MITLSISIADELKYYKRIAKSMRYIYNKYIIYISMNTKNILAILS